MAPGAAIGSLLLLSCNTNLVCDSFDFLSTGLERLPDIFRGTTGHAFRGTLDDAFNYIRIGHIKDLMRPQYVILRAIPDDLERIGEIERASFGAEAYDRKLFAYYMEKCGGLFLVAAPPPYRRGKAPPREKLCGYLIACSRGVRAGASAELVSVAVEPAARGRGAASALLESLLRRFNLDIQTKALLATIHSNGMRLLKLINDLLDLVRLESGRMEVKPEPLDIAEFVKAISSAARSRSAGSSGGKIASMRAQNSRRAVISRRQRSAM